MAFGARTVSLGAAAIWLAASPLSLAFAAGAQSPNAADLANACTSCHGIEGHSIGAIPSIGVLDRETLIVQLKAFRAQEGEATIMKRLVRGYTDAEIEALADYFSSVSKP